MAKLSRRKFIKIITSAASAGAARVLAPGLLLGGVAACQSQAPVATPGTLATASVGSSTPGEVAATATATAQAAATATSTAQATATLATPQRLQIGSRVVHLHSPDATHWGGQAAFWDYADQQAVNQMVERGITELTGQSTVADAWRALIPGYQPGKAIAIKVNFNNTLSGDCSTVGGAINALPQPVAAVIAGLKAMGVEERDVWIYDGVDRFIPAYFTAAVPYGGVQYFDKCHTGVDYYASQDASAVVGFNPPAGVPAPASQRVAGLLLQASYLINMPIMKSHSCASISLGFKNHFGSIDNPGGVHSHVFLVPACGGGIYPNYSPLVDIYRNPHLGGKTVLTIGDGLFGARGGQDAAPSTWSTFGGQVPNSLFFAIDPVAIDSVMADYLRAEPGAGVMAGADDYLQYAQDAGLGVFERGDPWGGGYRSIEYRKIEL
jgi:uncharacterized protein (DUF362 family)